VDGRGGSAAISGEDQRQEALLASPRLLKIDLWPMGVDGMVCEVRGALFIGEWRDRAPSAAVETMTELRRGVRLGHGSGVN
jgi:hypothetical protein